MIFSRDRSQRLSPGPRGTKARLGKLPHTPPKPLPSFDICVRNNEVSMDLSETLALSAWAGCLVTRECSNVAFAKLGRSMTTTDMIGEIGGVFRRVFEGDQMERL